LSSFDSLDPFREGHMTGYGRCYCIRAVEPDKCKPTFLNFVDCFNKKNRVRRMSQAYLKCNNSIIKEISD